METTTEQPATADTHHVPSYPYVTWMGGRRVPVHDYPPHSWEECPDLRGDSPARQTADAGIAGRHKDLTPLECIVTEFQPIKATSEYSPDQDFDQHYDHMDDWALAKILIGHKVTKVADDHLVLDDSTVLKLFGNDGGCGCSSGCYDLTQLNGVDNLITNVEFENNPDAVWDWEDDHHGPGVYRIFVIADNVRVNLATFEGTDGNGYYGTGYHVLVRYPNSPARPATTAAVPG